MIVLNEYGCLSNWEVLGGCMNCYCKPLKRGGIILKIKNVDLTNMVITNYNNEDNMGKMG